MGLYAFPPEERRVDGDPPVWSLRGRIDSTLIALGAKKRNTIKRFIYDNYRPVGGRRRWSFRIRVDYKRPHPPRRITYASVWPKTVARTIAKFLAISPLNWLIYCARFNTMLVPRFLFQRISFRVMKKQKTKNGGLGYFFEILVHVFLTLIFFIRKISRTTFEFFQNPLFDNIAPL